MKRIVPILIFLGLLVSIIALPAAAQDGGTDLLKQAKSINATVPQKGDAALGTPQSMTEMTDWLNQCSSALLGIFKDIMNLFGLGSMDYTQKMSSTLENGVQAAPGTPGK